MKLFKKKMKNNQRTFVEIQLNARLQPKDRFEIEDMIDDFLKKQKIGEVTGGGTFMAPSGQISCCNIELNIEKDQIDRLISFLNKLYIIPKGSALCFNEFQIQVGCGEGLSLYLNGTDLPMEVYKTCDVNELLEQLDEAMDGIGVRMSHWEGNEGTWIYYYGQDYIKMMNRILPITQKYPLCEKCVIEQIA